MSIKLDSEKLKQQLHKLFSELPLEECTTCECLQGFLTQLSLDSEDYSEVLKPIMVTQSEMHSCLGCSPCPPAEMMTEHLNHIREEIP
jgi:hypothetical protein